MNLGIFRSSDQSAPPFFVHLLYIFSPVINVNYFDIFRFHLMAQDQFAMHAGSDWVVMCTVSEINRFKINHPNNMKTSQTNKIMIKVHQTSKENRKNTTTAET